MNIQEIKEYLASRLILQYSRSNYDKYIKDTKFTFPIKSIHITGTNGKGSVAKYLSDIYLENGLKVGLYNSPFLIDVNEMIMINNEVIPDDDFASIFNELLPGFQKYNLTAFEMETIIAYTYFMKQNVDLAIIEVGLGGYIDATNIITPILSIITSVSLEHTIYLGRSVSEIAESKAGIIKPNVPCLVGELDESAMYSVLLAAKRNNSKIFQVSIVCNEKVTNEGVVFDYHPFMGVKISSHALYEAKNAAIAIEATQIIKNQIPVKFEVIQKGLLNKNLPCRYEYLNEHILIDGGHNPEAMENLVKSIQSEVNKPVHIVFAAMKDKNIDPMFIQLGLVSNDLTLTTWNHKRARTEEEYFLYLGDYQFEEDYKALVDRKLSEYPDDLLLVTGSLDFAGQVRDYLLNKKQ